MANDPTMLLTHWNMMSECYKTIGSLVCSHTRKIWNTGTCAQVVWIRSNQSYTQSLNNQTGKSETKVLENGATQGAIAVPIYHIPEWSCR